MSSTRQESYGSFPLFLPIGIQKNCLDQLEKETIFIAVAGMAAALAGNIAAIVEGFVPVIGVPLPSSEFPDAMDGLLSMVRMPSGRPVAVCGVGSSGLRNAAIYACQIVALYDAEIRARFCSLMNKTNPPAQIEIMLSERR